MTIGSRETERGSELTRLESELIGDSESPDTKKYRPIFRDFLVRLCMAVTLGLVFLFVVEMFAFWRGRQGQGAGMEPDIGSTSDQGTDAEREYWREHKASDKLQYQPYVLWRRAPYDGKVISINAEGIRRTLYTRCDATAKTIWMFGDSAMWGTGDADAETIPSLVAADYQKASQPVCIVNYGEKGWANSQELIELEQQLKHASHKPDVVLFYDGGTEAFTAYQNGQVDVHTNYMGFKAYLEGLTAEQKSGFSYLQRTNTYRLLKDLAARVSPKSQANHDENGKFSDAEVQAMSRAIMQNYLDNMNVIDLLAKQYGFRAIFTWYPNVAVGHKPFTPDEAELQRHLQRKFPGMDVFYRAAYDRCSEVSRPDLYNLANLLDGTKTSVYRGVAHLTGAGNQIVADRLFQILENPANSVKPNSGVISSSSSAPFAGRKVN